MSRVDDCIDPASPSLAQVINRGLSEARGKVIGVMIDGARSSAALACPRPAEAIRGWDAEWLAFRPPGYRVSFGRFQKPRLNILRKELVDVRHTRTIPYSIGIFTFGFGDAVLKEEPPIGIRKASVKVQLHHRRKVNLPCPLRD